MRTPFFGLLLLAAAGTAGAAGPEITGRNELKNPGFEAVAGDAAESWQPYKAGYRPDDTVSRSGGRSIACDAGSEALSVGACQIIAYDRPDDRPIVFGAWSRAENVNAPDYCIYLDVVFADGTEMWGFMRNFSPGTHDWEFAGGALVPEKPVREIHFYLLLRSGTGKVWFDDVKLSREADPAEMEWRPQKLSVDYDLPHSDGLQISAMLEDWSTQWQCLLLKDGEVIADHGGMGIHLGMQWTRPSGEAWPDTLRIITHLNGQTAEYDYAVDLTDPLLRPDDGTEAVSWWVEHAARKVWPLDSEPTGAAKAVDLTLAGREKEDVQIALRLPKTADSSVSIAVSDLAGPDGAIIDSASVDIFLTSSVWTRVPSHHPFEPHSAHSNWTPEILFPAREFMLKGGYAQTVWLEFAAAADQPAGVYRGEIQLTLKELEQVIEIPVKLEIYGFTLPLQPSFRNAFAQMDNFAAFRYGGMTAELAQGLRDIMLDYRLNPDDISRVSPPASAALQEAAAKGMTTYCVSHLVTDLPEGYLWKVGDPASAYDEDFYRQLTARLDDYYREVQALGLEAQGYLYGFDEWNGNVELMEEVCRFARERWPEWKTFTTASVMYHRRRDLPEDYEDFVDWYCPLIHAYDVELSRRLRRQGKEVWWYVCCWPRYPFPNLAFADLPALETRLLPWMTWQFESDGLLYWHVNLEWNQNPILGEWQPFSDWFQPNGGDGNLIYPGPSGPIPGIRMVNLRDGSEDYEYLALLEQLAGRDRAMAYAEKLIRSLTEFSRDPAELERTRRELAREIEDARKDSAGRERRGAAAGAATEEPER